MDQSNLEDFEVLDLTNPETREQKLKEEQEKKEQQEKIILELKDKDEIIKTLKDLLEERNAEIKTLKKTVLLKEIEVKDQQELQKIEHDRFQREIETLQADLKSEQNKIQNLKNESQKSNTNQNDSDDKKKCQDLEIQVQELQKKNQFMKQEIEDLQGICKAMDQSKIGNQDRQSQNLKNEIETLQLLLNDINCETYTNILIEKIRNENQGKDQNHIIEKVSKSFQDEMKRMQEIMNQNGVKFNYNFAN